MGHTREDAGDVSECWSRNFWPRLSANLAWPCGRRCNSSRAGYAEPLDDIALSDAQPVFHKSQPLAEARVPTINNLLGSLDWFDAALVTMLQATVTASSVSSSASSMVGDRVCRLTCSPARA